MGNVGGMGELGKGLGDGFLGVRENEKEGRRWGARILLVCNLISCGARGARGLQGTPCTLLFG